MLLRALAYDIEVHYLEGKRMFIADTLSRAYLPIDKEQDATEFEVIHAVQYLPMRDDVIQDIRDSTEQDSTLQVVKSVIQQGWPHKCDVPHPAMPYYHFRDELAVTDGLLFRGERLVIPHAMRSQIKKDIHLRHSGIEGCLRRAREYVY